MSSIVQRTATLFPEQEPLLSEIASLREARYDMNFFLVTLRLCVCVEGGGVGRYGYSYGYGCGCGGAVAEER